MSKEKPIKVLECDELIKLHTGTLMARRKALLQCEESLLESDKLPDYQTEQGAIKFKQTIKWQSAYQDLKKVLNDSEHWTK